MSGLLQKLRNAFMQKLPVEVTAKTIQIGSDGELDRKTKTNFKSMRGRGEPYPLDAIYFNHKFHELPYNAYVAACNREGADHVKVLDRKELFAYLSGESKTCLGLIEEASAPASAPVPSAQKEEVKLEPVSGTAAAEVHVGAFKDHRWDSREQRSIDSVLMLGDLNFSALCDKVAKHISNAKRGKAQSAAEKSERQRRTEAAATFDPRGDRYTSNEDRFWRENMGSDFKELGINPTGSFAASGVKQESTAPKPRPKPVPKPPSRGHKRKLMDPAELVPIIVVPGPGAGILNAANAKEFVENGKFLSEEEMRKKGIAPNLSYKIPVIREPGGNCSSAEYLIVSNINRLTETEWDRVVAVFCTGKEWQFKNWKLGTVPTDILRKVQGFYFYFKDRNPDANAQKWPLKMMPFARFDRRGDAHAHLEFWRTMDRSIQRHNKRVRF